MNGSDNLEILAAYLVLVKKLIVSIENIKLKACEAPKSTTY
jgi:hypothetical protein